MDTVISRTARKVQQKTDFFCKLKGCATGGESLKYDEKVMGRVFPVQFLIYLNLLSYDLKQRILTF